MEFSYPQFNSVGHASQYLEGSSGVTVSILLDRQCSVNDYLWVMSGSYTKWFVSA